MQLATLTIWNMVDHKTTWFNSFVSHSHGDSIYVAVAVSVLIAVLCLSKIRWYIVTSRESKFSFQWTGEKWHWHFSSVTANLWRGNNEQITSFCEVKQFQDRREAIKDD